MVVVFGAFGKTGTVVAARLREAGQRVLAVTHDPRRAPQLDAVLADLSDPVSIERVLSEAHAVHAILPDDLSALNFHAARRAWVDAFVRSVERMAVPRVVLVSSVLAALGEGPGNGFGAELAYFERRLLETNTSLTVLRCSYFQDNLRETLPLARLEGIYPCFFASAEQRLRMVAACDVGMLAARALLEPPPRRSEIIDVLGPEYSCAEIAEHVGRSVGRELTLVELGAERQRELFETQMSVQAAHAMVETLACLSKGVPLRGDRREHPSTVLQITLATEAA
jgi:uncharacterized protein YbjT (DUF2867 family)